jgi:hypothetical protein
MRSNMYAVRSFGLILFAPLVLSATGCALYRGDFVQSTASLPASTAPAAGPLDIKPAVLVQQGTGPTVTTAQPQRSANLDTLPPLPKGDVAPPSSTRVLSPEDKARVIAELEALARGDAATSAKPACALTGTEKSGTPQAAAGAGTNCVTPKPAPRP